MKEECSQFTSSFFPMPADIANQIYSNCDTSEIFRKVASLDFLRQTVCSKKDITPSLSHTVTTSTIVLIHTSLVILTFDLYSQKHLIVVKL